MQIVATNRDEQNHAAFDPWTVVHFAAGLALGLTKAPAGWAAVGAIAYEIIEQKLERDEFGQELFDTRGPESAANAIVDVLVFAGGYGLGRAWRETGE